MLAYAAQGLPSDAGSKSGGQLRDFLERFVNALTALAEGWRSAVSEVDAESAKRHHDFIAVLDRDARDTLAAIELVRAQPTISSQLIDNLNASIHLRALLTDLFLLDEIHKTDLRQKQAAALDSRSRLQ
jgi:hypothetical protein